MLVIYKGPYSPKAVTGIHGDQMLQTLVIIDFTQLDPDSKLAFKVSMITPRVVKLITNCRRGDSDLNYA
ncbi:hypothetical protein DPMN_012792 [Dreissena polymorpha]|uniref:Uncharacterized protein n=1 Tax=Dreissena polymorpha TaxID=45954 RepID=A0A9D4S3P4_DREPO|nr:hypothetical protein DPMN_012792 [Dreissena polymorpha]